MNGQEPFAWANLTNCPLFPFPLKKIIFGIPWSLRKFSRARVVITLLSDPCFKKNTPGVELQQLTGCRRLRKVMWIDYNSVEETKTGVKLTSSRNISGLPRPH